VLVSRRRRRDQARSAGSVSSYSVLPDPDLLPEDELLALERQRAVRAAVGELPARCRELIEALFSDATCNDPGAKGNKTAKIRCSGRGASR
jgi:DNA-directed RNA polymerase specialized sigma24 family protein